MKILTRVLGNTSVSSCIRINELSCRNLYQVVVHVPTHVVGPFQPTPPHWPYADCAVPVTGDVGADEVLEAALVEWELEEDEVECELDEAEVLLAETVVALLGGAAPAVSP